MISKTEALRSHSFLAGLDPVLIEKLAEIAVPEEFRKGQFLLRAGEEASRLYLILEGEAVVEVSSTEHSPIIIQSLRGGDVVGWSWLVPPHRWEFDVLAKTDLRTMALDAPRLRKLFKSDYQLGYEMILRFSAIIAGRLHSTRLQYLDLYKTHFLVGKDFK